MIAVQVNGRRVELDRPEPVRAYLERIGANPKAVAVELNGEILDRGAYESALLTEGAVMEVVRMVGGGSNRRSV